MERSFSASNTKLGNNRISSTRRKTKKKSNKIFLRQKRKSNTETSRRINKALDREHKNNINTKFLKTMSTKKIGRNRTMSICLTDIPRERIISHQNGKLYINVSSYDLDEPDKYDNDFSLTMSKTKEEIEKSKAGEKIPLIFIGNGRIWEDKEQVATPEEVSKKLDWLDGLEKPAETIDAKPVEEVTENQPATKEDDVPF